MIENNDNIGASGNRVWAIPGGWIPLKSTGPEPECTSRDELIILNTNMTEAKISIRIYYAERDPVGPYNITVLPERVRRVRCNDLIDPEPVPLSTDYAIYIESDLPVIVQFLQLDTGDGNKKTNTMMAFPVS